jgi:hypothetical protein
VKNSLPFEEFPLLVVGRILEMLGSREVSVHEIRPRVPWAPSHSFHVMPPRITRNSYRPRASDRTMVDLESPFACRSRQLDGTANSPEETHQNGHKSHFSSEA